MTNSTDKRADDQVSFKAYAVKIVETSTDASLMGVAAMRAGAWWLSFMATLPSTGADLSKITSCSWTKDAMARCETEYLTMSDQDNEDDCNLQLFENGANILGRAMYWNSNSDACIVCEGTAKDWTIYTRHRVHVCEITGCSSGYYPASDGTDCLYGTAKSSASMKGTHASREPIKVTSRTRSP